jgi:hypothetical protein
MKRRIDRKRRKNLRYSQKIFYTLTALTVLLWILYLSLTPVFSRDALILHMAFTKIWAKNSFFFYQDFNLSTVSMMNLDYLYMLLFRFFEWDGWQKILHASFLVMSSISIFRFLKERFGLNSAFFMTVCFALIPVNQRLTSEVYVDLGVLFFSTVAVIHFIKWLESDQTDTKEIIISAAGAGLSVGTKYTGAILAAVIILVVGYAHGKKTQNSLKSLRIVLLYSLIVFLFITPWLIRNYAAVGNPFFPFLNSVFDPDIIKPDSNLTLPPNEYATRRLFGESGLYILLIPFRFFFTGRDNDLVGGFDGVLNPLLLILLIPLFIPRIRQMTKNPEIVKYLISSFLIMLSFFLVYGHLRIRYFIFALPVLIILNSYLLEVIKTALKPKMFTVFSIIAVTSFMYFNISYSVLLFKRVDTIGFISGKESKDDYLGRKMSEYIIAQKINNNAPSGAVIYEVLCGHRTYYIERPVVFDDSILDRYLYNMIDTMAVTEDYLRHFSNLPFRDHKKADYLMIKPTGFVQTYRNAFSENQPDSLVDAKISKFNEFLNSQFLVFNSNGNYLFWLIYR